MSSDLATFVLALAVQLGADAAAPNADELYAAALEVTSGALGDAPAMRARALGTDGARSVELAFRWLGPSTESAPLASGELRRQIGVTLRAKDTCNVVYVMWHLEPDRAVAVSVKRNPGAASHAECGAHGYVNVSKEAGEPAPRVGRGERHVLRADLDGDVLHVTADGIVVWRGRLPAEAESFDGPVGVRSDNGAFDVAVRAGRGRPRQNMR